MDTKLPSIHTARLVLRLATTSDIPAVVEYYTTNRVFHAPWDPRRPAEFFTSQYWQAQVERNREDFYADRAVRLCLFPQEQPDHVIGVLNASNIVRGAAQYCTLGYSLTKQAQGRGYMSEALQAVISYLFEQRGMHRVMANYMPRNQASANVLKRLGFVVEGYARDYLRINDRWEDHMLTSLINSNEQAIQA